MSRSRWTRRGGQAGLAISMLMLVQIIFTPVALASGQNSLIKDVPLYLQQHSLSCEYAAARMVTAYWGYQVSESQFIRAIPVSSNPHLGYRGNINGGGGGLRDYGIYAEPIANYLAGQGFKTWVFYGGVSNLRQQIDNGHPVIVWLTIALQYATPSRVNIDGVLVKLVPGEHTVVITGYDEGGVYLNGSAQGIRTKFAWGAFLRSWSYFDQMALTIWK